MLLAAASSKPWDVVLPAAVWARAGDFPSAEGVSKVWRRLGKSKLITRSRKNRKAAITLLREDGSGAEYQHPSEKRERYAQLPFEYWTAEQRWYRTLDLSETAVLLIARSLKNPFVLPAEKAAGWYDLAPDTIEKGLRGLQDHGLLRMHKDYKERPLTADGYTEVRLYTLRPPFARRNNSVDETPSDGRIVTLDVRKLWMGSSALVRASKKRTAKLSAS